MTENADDGSGRRLLINEDKGDAGEVPPSAPRVSIKMKVLILCACVALTILNVVYNIARKRMLNAFGSEYVFFRQELTNFMYNIWATFVLLYKIFFTSAITPEMWSFPMWKFAMLGFFDGASDFLSSVGGVHTAGSWQVLLSQTLVLFIMVFSFFIMKSRYKIIQLVGVFAVIAGSSLAVIPSISDNSQYWYSVIIYTSNNIPGGLSYVVKEYYFKAVNLDIFYLTVWVSWIQLVISWVFVPVLSLPGFGGVSLDDIPSVFKNGFLCFTGDSSIPVTGGTQDYCSSFNTWITFLFSITGFFGNILSLWMVKNSSAVLMIVVTAISLPMANLVFSIDWLMGRDVEPFSWYDVGGLVLVVAGFLIYSLTSKSALEQQPLPPPSSPPAQSDQEVQETKQLKNEGTIDDV